MFVLKEGRSCQLITTYCSCLHFESFETLEKTKDFLTTKNLSNQWESLAAEEIQTAFADNIACKFRPLLKTLKLSGVCFEQQSSRPLLIVADVSVLEGRKVARKELLGGAKMLKKLFVRKKWPIRPGLQVSHQWNFVCSTPKHVRRQPQKLNCLRKGPGRNSEKG